MYQRIWYAIRQLILELSIPLAVGVALAYRDYSNLLPSQNSSFSWIDDIGKRAFVVSFLLVAFLRIWKSQASDEKLSGVDTKIRKINDTADRLLETLKQTTAQISAQVSGGTSKCAVWMTPVEQHKRIFGTIVAEGVDPLIDLEVKMDRLNGFTHSDDGAGNTSWSISPAERIYSSHFPTLHPHHPVYFELPLGESDQFIFHVTCTAKNGATETVFICKRMPEWNAGWGTKLFEIHYQPYSVVEGREFGPEGADWSWTNEQ